jgi:hypothetical protein
VCEGRKTINGFDVMKLCAILVVVIIQQGEDIMSNKIKVPNFVAETIEELRKEGLNNFQIFNHSSLQEYAQRFPDQLMRALLDGYEAKEERISYEDEYIKIWRRPPYMNKRTGEMVYIFNIKLKSFGSGDIYLNVKSNTDKVTYKKIYNELQYLPTKE